MSRVAATFVYYYCTCICLLTGAVNIIKSRTAVRLGILYFLYSLVGDTPYTRRVPDVRQQTPSLYMGLTSQWTVRATPVRYPARCEAYGIRNTVTFSKRYRINKYPPSQPELT